MSVNNTAKLAFDPDKWARQAISHYNAGRNVLELWFEGNREDRALYEASAAEIQAAIAAAEISQALRAI